jgi:hypothetical protein
MIISNLLCTNVQQNPQNDSILYLKISIAFNFEGIWCAYKYIGAHIKIYLNIGSIWVAQADGNSLTWVTQVGHVGWQNHHLTHECEPVRLDSRHKIEYVRMCTTWYFLLNLYVAIFQCNQ